MMSRVRKRHRCRNASRRTRRRQCFEKGTYVTWKGDEGCAERKEGRVLHDDGRRVSVLGRGTSLLGVTLNKRSCNLHESKWRHGVKVGDIVEVTVMDNEWHPSLVRAVQHPGPRAVLVLEPVFLGYTISVPLHSFKVRSPQIEHCELQSLLDMGLAFDDFNKLAANHPAYHPFGSLDSPGSVKPIMRFFYNDGSTSACWVVQAPCTLPNRLRLVRDLTGVLRFCLDCNLLPPNMNPVAPVETQRAKLGSVIIPLWKPPEIDETNRHVFSCNLANTLQEHLRHGDDTLAAELLDTHRDPLLTLCTFDEEKESLATALCAAARKPYGVDKVSGTCWQHAYGGREYFVSQDLESLHASLKRLMAGHRAHNLNMQELVQLDVRVNMWRMYKKWYGRAHDLRQSLQRVQPLAVSLSPDSLPDNKIKFDVHVNYGSETLYDSTTGSERLHRVDSVILEHFTKFALGADPSSDPPLDERASAPAHSEWTDWLQEPFESMVKRVCARRDSVVDAVLHREQLPCTKLQYCLSRKLKCEDGRTLFWNACEGVVEKLVVDSLSDDYPEALSALTQPPPLERQGGVLVHDNATDKMNCVVDILTTERQRPGPADRGATIIYTTPTLLYFWHRHLTAAGIGAYVFHGSNRRNQRVIDAMNREDVILSSWSALQCVEDTFHLTRSDVPVWRVFVDEFDTGHVALANGIIRCQSRSTWLLCRRYELKTLALALPLLGVRPFCLRSGWNEPQNSVLQSNFAQRRHVHAMIGHRHLQGARSALLHLCRSMVLCQTPSAPVALVLQRANHACTSTYTNKHIDALQRFGQKILRDSRKHSLVLRSSSFIANMVKRITMMCWGVMPPFNLLADRIGFGRYTTDAALHLQAMKSVAEMHNSGQQESQKEACVLVRNLRDKKQVDAQCPICFEKLTETNADGEEGDSSKGRLPRTVVVGQCGHAVCGECADSIMRTAAENLVSGANDYGPTAPINSACCPICRHTWTAPAKRPLMLSTEPSTELRNVEGAVFEASNCPQARDLVEGNPMVKSLKRVCDSLAPSSAGVQESGSTNIVVVCRSQELVSHLQAIVRCKNLTHKTYKISRSTTAKGRGKALAEFAKPAPAVQLKILFVTASLVRGMVFHRTRHYVVVEDLKAKETEDLKYAMHASLLTFPPEQRLAPVTVHTIVAPLCPGKACARGVTRIAPTVMIPPARKGCIPTRPSVERLDNEYISRIHAFFGWPPRRPLPRQTSAAVRPQPLPLDTTIQLFDARLDALLALGSALDDTSATLNVALQEEPHSLRLLLENQPTTIVIPQNETSNATVSGTVHI